MIPTINGTKKSPVIKFRRGLLQGDSICGCLYTISINPTAWKLRTHDRYQLSKPVQGKMTHGLFVEDLKIYTKSKEKLTKVLSDTKSQMMDAGLVWREVKCAVLHLKRGKVVDKDGDIRLNEENNPEMLGKSTIQISGDARNRHPQHRQTHRTTNRKYKPKN